MYKFNNLATTIIYSKKEKNFVKKLNKEIPNVWKDEDTIAQNPNFKYGDNAKRLRLKDSIRKRLLILQGEFCIYCGAEFSSASTTHIEHIMPKDIYPEYTFEPLNLALACQRCNIDLKRVSNYVTNYDNKNYKNCKLSIVHPYLNNLDRHMDYSDVIIGCITQKGFKTIDEFKLNDERLLTMRGLTLMGLGILSEDMEVLVKNILSRNYSTYH